MKTPMICPKCKGSLRGSQIPTQHQDAYGGATHYSRAISVYDSRRDEAVAWQCPDCAAEWPRTHKHAP